MLEITRYGFCGLSLATCSMLLAGCAHNTGAQVPTMLAKDTSTSPDAIAVDAIMPALRHLPVGGESPMRSLESEALSIPAGARVINRTEFDRMLHYLQNTYDGLKIVSSITVGTQSFDCIATSDQPSLRSSNEPADTAPSSDTPGALVLGQPGAVCPTGTIPLARMKIATLSTFRTLEEFLSRDHQTDGRLRLLAQTALPHRYAVLHRPESPIEGLRSRLNVWSPSVSGNDMSLSQTWIVGSLPAQTGTGSVTQTLESGWQRWAGWDQRLAVPFVYSTRDGYASQDGSKGCYNLLCKGFVQTTPQVVFARFADDRYSMPGGRQGELAIEWQRKTPNGNWWVKMNGVWVGYYPASLYVGGTLANPKASVRVDFGGENTGVTPYAEMGSGRFADAGRGEAAYQREMGTLDAQGRWTALSAYWPTTTDTACYSLVRMPATGPNIDSFFFGGPGTRAPGCSAAGAQSLNGGQTGATQLVIRSATDSPANRR